MMQDEMNADNPMPAIISLSSGKGGVGKTFISVHLAIRAAEQGHKVLLIDADLGLANVDIMMGLTAKASIFDVVSEHASLDEVKVVSRYGFDVIPGGSGFQELSALEPDKQAVLFQQLSAMAADYDLVILDNAAGIGDNVLYFASSSSIPVVVMTADPTSMTDAYALMKTLYLQRRVQRFKLLLNRSSDVEARTVFKRIDTVVDRYLSAGLDYLGHIPESDQVSLCIRKQRSLPEIGAEKQWKAMQAVLDHLIHEALACRSGSIVQPFWMQNLALTASSSVPG